MLDENTPWTTCQHLFPPRALGFELTLIHRQRARARPFRRKTISSFRRSLLRRGSSLQIGAAVEQTGMLECSNRAVALYFGMQSARKALNAADVELIFSLLHHVSCIAGSRGARCRRCSRSAALSWFAKVNREVWYCVTKRLHEIETLIRCTSRVATSTSSRLKVVDNVRIMWKREVRVCFYCAQQADDSMPDTSSLPILSGRWLPFFNFVNYSNWIGTARQHDRIRWIK